MFFSRHCWSETHRHCLNFTDFVQPLTGICGFRPTHRLSTASSWSSQPAALSSTPPTPSRNTWASTRYHQHTSHTRDSALRGWSSEGGRVGGCPTSSHPLGLRAASAGGSGYEGGSPSLIHQSSSLRALQAQRLKLQARSTWPIYSTALFFLPGGQLRAAGLPLFRKPCLTTAFSLSEAGQGGRTRGRKDIFKTLCARSVLFWNQQFSVLNFLKTCVQTKLTPN